MIDFPASPTNGQVFISGAQSWTYDGTKWVASGTAVMPPLSTGDNRIINGDMRIDQRNAGASGTAAGYTVDRWTYAASQASKGTWQRSGSVVGGLVSLGFGNALSFTSSSAYTVVAADYFAIQQPIEADMISDFAWGTPNAQPVTLSFWVYSSLTGTFGGCVQNYAFTRSYPFSYQVTVANTWTKITITIPGDTAGTWVMSGNVGSLILAFSLGMGATRSAPANAWAAGNFLSVNGAVSVVGTNGATFNLTGVKLEIGSVATPYPRQSLTKSMADCQRYYQQTSNSWISGTPGAAVGFYGSLPYNTVMRAAPTAAFLAPAYTNASAIASVFIYPDSFVIRATATAVGVAQAGSPTALSAEL